MRYILLMCACVMLTACETTPLTALNYQEQNQMIATILDRCHKMGAASGTPEEKQCFAQEVKAEQYRRDQNIVAKRRAHAAFSAMAAAGAAQRPVNTTCSRAFSYINCTTY